MNVRRIIPDFFTVALIGVVLLATFFPCRWFLAEALGWLSNLAIAILFFLHGAKLSSQAVRAGLTNWRLHLAALCCTFVMFPILGLIIRPFLFFMDLQAAQGIMFICILPSTVQSSIAFTSIAKGNVAAAICNASISSLLGMFLTPFLASLLIMPQAGAHISFEAVLSIVFMMFLPFALGQLLRNCLQAWLMSNRFVISIVDQGSILLIVYSAFSAAVIQQLWSRLSLSDFIALTLICAFLLLLMLCLTVFISKVLKFNREDRMAIIFCGSKKSLATGVPMLGVLFAGQNLGLMVLPIMIFHQMQLLACAFLAPYFARSAERRNQVAFGNKIK